MKSLKLTTLVLATTLISLSPTRAQWVELDISKRQVTNLAAEQASPGSTGSVLYAGTVSDGVFRSSDNGDSWLPLDRTPLDSLEVLARDWTAMTGWGYNSAVGPLVVRGKFLFASMRMAGIFRSSDRGRSWIGVNSGMADRDEGRFNRSHAVHVLAADKDFLFAQTESRGVYCSMDNGSSWVEANNGLPYNEYPITGRFYHIATMYVVPGRAHSVLLAMPRGYGIYRSSDDGGKWSELNSSLPSWKIHLAFVAFADSTGTCNILAGTDSARVYLSTDQGITWALLNSGLPRYMEFRCFAVSPASGGRSGSLIFAGTSGIVYLSRNDARSWTPVRKGMRWLDIQSLTVGGDYLFAQTVTGHIWRRSIQDMVAEASKAQLPQ